MIPLRRQIYLMKMAITTAEQSYAEKLKVGAVAVRHGRPICTGYNGTPPGEDNCCEEIVYEMWDHEPRSRLKTKDDVEHAERNLIYFAAAEGIPLRGASLFITHSPCIECARAILHVGIAEVYYQAVFNHQEGLVWLQARVPTYQVIL